MSDSMTSRLGLSNLQIDRHFKGNVFYGGCLSKDELKNISPGNKFWIINMEDSTAADGTHWILVFDCVIPDDNPDYTIYMDPYGVYPPPEILKFMNKSDKEIHYTIDTYQDIDSINCGNYCIYVAEEILNSTPYQELFEKRLSEHNVPANEKLMNQLKFRQ